VDEGLIVEAFVVRTKRERYRGVLASRRTRKKFLAELYHFDHFDPAVVVALPTSVRSAQDLLLELRSRGAGERCYIISNVSELDGTSPALSEAVDRVFGVLDGTIISCVPGSLAYYEGEAPKNRFILHRRAA
jgi:hypothetical protein